MAEVNQERSVSSRIQPGVTHALFAYATDAHPAFGLYNLDKQVFEATHHPSQKLPEFVQQPDWKEINASIPTPFYSLIPGSEYHPEKKRSYLETLYGELPEGEIREYPTLIQQRVFVYLEEPKFTHFLKANFTTLRISSAFANMISAQESLIGASAHQFYVHCEADTFLLSVFLHRKLSLFNHFQGQQGKDVLYFVNLAAQQLSVQMNEVELIVSGEKTDENVSFLSPYVQRCLSLAAQFQLLNIGPMVPLPAMSNKFAPLTLAPLCA